MPGRDQLIKPRHQVIAADNSNRTFAQTGSIQNRARLLCTASWIHAARVRDDLQIRLFTEDRTEPFQDIEEISREARPWISLFLQREDRHRQFGEIFEREVIEPAIA